MLYIWPNRERKKKKNICVISWVAEFFSSDSFPTCARKSTKWNENQFFCVCVCVSLSRFPPQTHSANVLKEIVPCVCVCTLNKRRSGNVGHGLPFFSFSLLLLPPTPVGCSSCTCVQLLWVPASWFFFFFQCLLGLTYFSFSLFFFLYFHLIFFCYSAEETTRFF